MRLTDRQSSCIYLFVRKIWTKKPCTANRLHGQSINQIMLQKNHTLYIVRRYLCRCWVNQIMSVRCFSSACRAFLVGALVVFRRSAIHIVCLGEPLTNVSTIPPIPTFPIYSTGKCDKVSSDFLLLRNRNLVYTK